MAEYDLPSGPAELFEAVRHTLGVHVGGQRNMRLGGGTALAARWAHRHSTDVDLFISADHYQRLFDNRDSFQRDAERHLSASAVVIEEGLVALFVRQPDQLGEITLATTPAMTPVPHSFDTVRGTDVALETNAEILAKKLRYRMVLRQQLVPRDLYDIAVARDRDPAALRQALGVIDSFSLQEMYTHLDSLPERWMANHRQRLIRPTFRRAASSPVSIVKHIVADHIHARPPAGRPRTDMSWDR
ncbi:MAG: nucleotidyl transferase AbiEii/AbiGii toxin family protein [Gammaproteobacteria bacterium]|nr:nucleotidyl transferase AbiEii/AbiGii toxin family protein [Gammaproteobacteria bacterium]